MMFCFRGVSHVTVTQWVHWIMFCFRGVSQVTVTQWVYWIMFCFRGVSHVTVTQWVHWIMFCFRGVSRVTVTQWVHWIMFCFRGVSHVTVTQWVHWITRVISTQDSVSVGLAWPARGVMSAKRTSTDSLCLAANRVNVTRLDLLLFIVTPWDSVQWVQWKHIL